MTFKVKKLKEEATIPTKAYAKDAGYDLYACTDEPIVIPRNENRMVPTGLSIALPDGTFGAVFARSGMATKHGLRPANAVGVCDSEYRGEYMVALYNDSKYTQVVRNGDRMAQLVIMPFIQGDIEMVENLDDTLRGSGGFGSTGTN